VFLLDIIRRIGRPWPLVSRNNGHGLERLDLVERRDPILPGFGVRLTQVKMSVVVGGGAGNDQPDRRGVEAGRVVRIGMPDGNAHKLLPFQFDERLP